MIFTSWVKYVFLPVPEMIPAVGFFPGHKKQQQRIEKPGFKIFFIMPQPVMVGKHCIAYFKIRISYIPGKRGIVGDIASSIAPYVNDQVFNMLFPECPETLSEKDRQSPPGKAVDLHNSHAVFVVDF